MVDNMYFYHHMPYQVNPKDQTQDIGQKPHFWPFGSFKNAFLWSLNDPSWPGNIAESWKTFSTITICNIKSIQQTKLQKMAKNFFFDTSDHSKMQFCDFWMIQHDLVHLSHVVKHSALSQYAIPSQSNRPNSWKWPKTWYLALRVIQKCIFVMFEWSFMTG